MAVVAVWDWVKGAEPHAEPEGLMRAEEVTEVEVGTEAVEAPADGAKEFRCASV